MTLVFIVCSVAIGLWLVGSMIACETLYHMRTTIKGLRNGDVRVFERFLWWPIEGHWLVTKKIKYKYHNFSVYDEPEWELIEIL
jgi:hypothetical protein